MATNFNDVVDMIQREIIATFQVERIYSKKIPLNAYEIVCILIRNEQFIDIIAENIINAYPLYKDFSDVDYFGTFFKVDPVEMILYYNGLTRKIKIPSNASNAYKRIMTQRITVTIVMALYFNLTFDRRELEGLPLTKQEVIYILMKYESIIKGLADYIYKIKSNDILNLMHLEINDVQPYCFIYLNRLIIRYSNRFSVEIPIILPNVVNVENEAIEKIKKTIELKIHKRLASKFSSSQIDNVKTSNIQFIRDSAQLLYDNHDEDYILIFQPIYGFSCVSKFCNIDLIKMTISNLNSTIPIIVSAPTLLEICGKKIKELTNKKYIGHLPLPSLIINQLTTK